jgi:hypothetical protein
MPGGSRDPLLPAPIVPKPRGWIDETVHGEPKAILTA